MLVIAIATACGGSGSGDDDGGDHDAAMPSDAISSDGTNANSDGGTDAAPVSHAPCPTCCDPIAQTGCGVGQACYQGDDSDTYCGTAGTDQLNYICFADSECAAGLECFQYNGDNKCRKFCTSNADCPTPSTNGQCLLGSKPPEAPYGLCF